MAVTCSGVEEGYPLQRLTVEREYLPGMGWNNGISVFNINSTALIPIQEMDHGRRRPVTHIEVIKDDALRENHSRLVGYGA